MYVPLNLKVSQTALLGKTAAAARGSPSTTADNSPNHDADRAGREGQQEEQQEQQQGLGGGAAATRSAAGRKLYGGSGSGGLNRERESSGTGSGEAARGQGGGRVLRHSSRHNMPAPAPLFPGFAPAAGTPAAASGSTPAAAAATAGGVTPFTPAGGSGVKHRGVTPGGHGGDEEGVGGSDAAATEEGVVVSRVTPCLLPERHLLRWVQVSGPRYWPQLLEGRVMQPSAAVAGAAAGVAAGSVVQQEQQQQQNAAAGARGRSPLGMPPAAGEAGAEAAFFSQQQLQAGSSSSSWSSSVLDMLYQRQQLYVKKRAGALSYADDPSGIRSLLSRAFQRGRGMVGSHLTAADAGAGALAAKVAKWSKQLPGDGQGAMEAGGGGSNGDEGEEEEEGGGGAGQLKEDEGVVHDVVHLCRTFSADPYIMGFAYLVSAAVGQHRAGARGTAGGGAVGRDGGLGEFLMFCHSCLYECTTEEKGPLLPWYLQLQALVAALAPLHPSRTPAAAAGVGGEPGTGAEGIVGGPVARRSARVIGMAAAASTAAGAGGCGNDCSFSSSSRREALERVLTVAGRVQGLVGPRGLTAALWDLKMCKQYYSSGIAVATALWQQHALQLQGNGSSRGMEGGEGGQRGGVGQKEGGVKVGGRGESSEGDAGGWRPLLQPGLVDSLWLSLMQLWEQIGFLPGGEGGLAGDTSGAGGGSGRTGAGGVTSSTTVLTQYCWEGSLQGAVARVVQEFQQQHQGVPLQPGQVEWLQQLLGACLAIQEVPHSAQIAEAAGAAAAAGRQAQQQAGPEKITSGMGGGMSSERLQGLSAAARALPGTPAGTVLLLGKAGVLG